MRTQNEQLITRHLDRAAKILLQICMITLEIKRKKGRKKLAVCNSYLVCIFVESEKRCQAR